MLYKGTEFVTRTAKAYYTLDVESFDAESNAYKRSELTLYTDAFDSANAAYVKASAAYDVLQAEREQADKQETLTDAARAQLDIKLQAAYDAKESSYDELLKAAAKQVKRRVFAVEYHPATTVCLPASVWNIGIDIERLRALQTDSDVKRYIAAKFAFLYEQ